MRTLDTNDYYLYLVGGCLKTYRFTPTYDCIPLEIIKDAVKDIFPSSSTITDAPITCASTSGDSKSVFHNPQIPTAHKLRQLWKANPTGLSTLREQTLFERDYDNDDLFSEIEGSWLSSSITIENQIIRYGGDLNTAYIRTNNYHQLNSVYSLRMSRRGSVFLAAYRCPIIEEYDDMIRLFNMDDNQKKEFLEGLQSNRAESPSYFNWVANNPNDDEPVTARIRNKEQFLNRFGRGIAGGSFILDPISQSFPTRSNKTASAAATDKPSYYRNRQYHRCFYFGGKSPLLIFDESTPECNVVNISRLLAREFPSTPEEGDVTGLSFDQHSMYSNNMFILYVEKLDLDRLDSDFHYGTSKTCTDHWGRLPHVYWERIPYPRHSSYTNYPSPRYCYGSCLIPEQRQIYYYGGWSGFSTFHSDLYTWHIDQHYWTKVDITYGIPPCPRCQTILIPMSGIIAQSMTEGEKGGSESTAIKYLMVTSGASHRLNPIPGESQVIDMDDVYLFDLVARAWLPMNLYIPSVKGGCIAPCHISKEIANHMGFPTSGWIFSGGMEAVPGEDMPKFKNDLTFLPDFHS